MSENQPYTIRGHHLGFLTPLVAPMYQDPEQLAQHLRKESVSDRSSLSAEVVDWSVLTRRRNDSQYWPVYAYDLIGDTDVQGGEFEATLTRTLRSFCALTEDAAVVLTAQGLDEVCGSCTFKRHCKAPEEMEEDARYLDVFEDVLAYAQTKDDTLTESATRLTSGDILTTARAVRRVLGHFAIANLWRGNLYRDAIERRKKYGNVFGGPDLSEVEMYYHSYGNEIV